MRASTLSAEYRRIEPLALAAVPRSKIVIAVAGKILGNRMNDLLDKEHLLEGSGYRYHFARMIYRNRTTKRAFSIEFVEDHSVQELRKLVAAPPTGDWVFHFNQPPPDSIKGDLIEDLEK